MTTTTRFAAALAATSSTLCALALAACSSSSSPAPAAAPGDAGGDAADASDGGAEAEAGFNPNVSAGHCVLSDGLWYCGAGYGTFASCPFQSQTLGEPCTFDGGAACLVCNAQGGGVTYECGGVSGWTVDVSSSLTCGL